MLPYSPEHLTSIQLRAHESLNLKRDKLQLLFNATISCTMVDAVTEEVIAIGGYVIQAPGFVEVFVIPSCHTVQYGLRLVRMVKRYLHGLETTLPEFRRMETRSLADDATDKWMRLLGFTCEGVCRKFAPDGSDYKMWSKVVGDG